MFEPLEIRRLLSVNVTTYHYSNAETGANTNETTLTLNNVSASTFGKIASMNVSGQIYGQPLIVTGVPMTNGQGTHDIVLVTTETDLVYAFDAYGNNPAQGYLWKTSLLQTGETTVPESDYGSTDITPSLGITGTPVINAATDVMYLVGLFKESNATYQQRIYALNISSGTNAIAPVTIAATFSGSTYNTGTYSNPGGVVTFSAFRENQRPALTLANGEVYIGWSSHGDQDPWHGWVIAYNAATLHQDFVYCDTADGQQGGIWMSGGGLAVDSSGNIYFTTGNGTFDANSNTTVDGDYSMSLEELSPSLIPQQYFAPYNEASLSNSDLDFGCANVILLTGQGGSYPNEVLSAGKWGQIYLSNMSSLGGFSSSTNNVLGQANLSGATLTNSNVHNTMVYWNGSVYLGGDALTLQAFSVANGVLGTTPSSQTSRVFGSASVEDGQGAGLTVSSNGTSNGIVWALDNTGFLSTPAVLYAYNSSNLSQVLWTSSSAANNRDAANVAIKFQDPVVANGYVYTAGDGSLTVYGLLKASSGTPAITAAAAVTPSPVTGTTASLSVLATDPAGDLSPNYTWTATSIPNGATAPTFSSNDTNTANNQTVTFYKAGAYTFTATIEDPNSGLTTTSTVNVTVNQTLTAMTVTPVTATVINAATQQFTASSNDQFGLAMTTQPTFTWSVAAGGAGGTVNSSGLYTAPASGTGTDTVTATANAGALSASATVVVAIPSSTFQISLTNYFNHFGIASSGTHSIPTPGIDGDQDGLAGALLGTSQTWNASSFVIGPTTTANNTNNVVDGTGQTITLSPGHYTAIKLLALHWDGNSTEQFTLNYSDGSTQTITQSFSDWFTPQSYAGESNAISMSYRITSNGSQGRGPFYLYGYVFTPTYAKTLVGITLPSDVQLDVASMDAVGTLVPTVVTAAAANPTTVTGTTTSLSVGGTDPSGDASPTFTWVPTNMPSGAVTPTFSVNGTTTSNLSTATFHTAGAYTFTVYITDPTTQFNVSSSVAVTVSQTLTSIVETPANVRLYDAGTQQFTAIANDQFGIAMSSQPTIAWSVKSGGVGGTVNASSGIYTAPVTGTGTDTLNASSGSVSGGATITVVNPVPTVTTGASANPSPVTGNTTTLKVLATDAVGDAVPTYTWAATNLPGGATTPLLSPNGGTTSNVSTATFYEAGAYTFTVTITDPTTGDTTTSSVNVTVNQTVTSITETPSAPTVYDAATQQFVATAHDQFGNVMSPEPAFAWIVKSGGVGGTVNASTGLYTAPSAGAGTDTVNASGGAISGTDTVTVVNPHPTLTATASANPSPVTGTTTVLSALATDAAGDAVPTYTWATTNLPGGATTPIFSVNGTTTSNVSTATFYKAGAYTFTVTIKDPTTGDTTTSSVNVTVNPTVSSINVTPAGPVGLYNGQTQQFSAAAFDQFGASISSQPTFTWTVPTGLGSISGTGLYQAPASGIGAATVKASSGAASGQASVQVNQPAWLGAGSIASWNSATGILTVTGASSIVADPGADQPIVQANGSSAVLTINPTGVLQIHLGGLSLTNGASATVASLGAARTAANHRVLVLGLSGATSAPLLSIDSSSQLNLADNDMVDHDGNLAAINGLLQSGFNATAGYWNGPGIASSNAAAGTLNALGESQPAVAGTFDNETVGAADVEIRFTYVGDANLDGHVDGSDYSLIDNGFLHPSLTGWSNGDFNYDGVVNGSDYTLIDNAFNQQAASLDAAAASPAAQIAAPAATTVATKPATSRRTAIGSVALTGQPDALISEAPQTAIDSLLSSTAAPGNTKRADPVKSSGPHPGHELLIRSQRRSKAAKHVWTSDFSDVKISVGQT